MAANVRYEVTLTDDVVEVEGADAYAPDGRMTTFYRCRDDRQAIDSWATRVASFRTADIVRILRRESELSSIRVA
ncbi:MAG TPA: hypothetical protein VIR58_19410 [Acidimicrobiales bacterium]